MVSPTLACLPHKTGAWEEAWCFVELEQSLKTVSIVIIGRIGVTNVIITDHVMPPGNIPRYLEAADKCPSVGTGRWCQPWPGSGSGSDDTLQPLPSDLIIRSVNTGRGRPGAN